MDNSNLESSQKRYEMAFSPADFEKTLQGQFISSIDSYTSQQHSSLSWTIAVNTDDNTFFYVEIKIEEAPPRIIAMLSLPVLNVSFNFIKANTDQQDVFLKRFFKYFHKGGG